MLLKDYHVGLRSADKFWSSLVHLINAVLGNLPADLRIQGLEPIDSGLIRVCKGASA